MTKRHALAALGLMGSTALLSPAAFAQTPPQAADATDEFTSDIV
ncbi:MAG: hypothetical protein JWR77_1990, partial [Rhizorhabdus sp.]|nr:hypothetical protein [Rhizorhabdus sp.]